MSASNKKVMTVFQIVSSNASNSISSNASNSISSNASNSISSNISNSISNNLSNIVNDNIIDYVLKHGDKTCSEREFGEVDALVLSQLSYFRWDKIVPPLFDDEEQDMPGIELKDMYRQMDAEYVYKHELYPEENAQLIKAMAESRRFSDMVCNYYVSDTRIADEMQFAAMTFSMKGALPIIVFRGTDGTIVGWREDFNMAFSKPYAGAFRAEQYVKSVASRLKGDFMVAGHSKGGSLAAFSAMSVPKRIRQRITDIYSFDGPGFRPEILEEYDYVAIASRVHKYLPKSSLVGIVLEGCQDYVTVKSYGVGGVFQHDPYRWCIEDTAFVREDAIKKKSQVMHKSLNGWIMELEEEDIALLIDTMFGIIESTEAQSISELLDNWKASLRTIKQSALGVDQEKRRKLKKIIRALLEVIYKCLMEEIQEQKQEHGIKPV